MTATPVPPFRRGPGCPPAATLEALSAGEPVPAPVAAHAEACGACSAHLAALRAEADAFLRARPADRFLRQLERRAAAPARPPRRAWRRWLVPALAVAVPALLALLVLPTAQRAPGVHLKGNAFRVAVARAAGGTPELAGADAVVHAGDALRFSYEAERPGHLLVLELDGRGQAAVVHPFGGARSAPLEPGRREFLPGSVVLDDAPGPELLLAVHAPRPLDAAPLVEQLRRQAGRPEPRLECADCEITVLRLQKRP